MLIPIQLKFNTKGLKLIYLYKIFFLHKLIFSRVIRFMFFLEKLYNVIKFKGNFYENYNSHGENF